MFQVGGIKRILQKKLTVPITAKVLKQYYDKELEIRSGEAATEHFLTTALALFNALFSIPKLKAPWRRCVMYVSIAEPIMWSVTKFSIDKL